MPYRVQRINAQLNDTLTKNQTTMIV